MYKNSALSIWLQSLHHWNVDGYDMGIRSQYLDDEGIQYTGMRTEQLALWLIERKDECIENIISVSKMMGLDIVSILNEREYLEKFIDTRNVSDKDIKLIIKQIHGQISRGSNGQDENRAVYT